MHKRNYGFFILDDEILIKNGPVTITVDHSTLMSIVYIDHWDSLRNYEKEFVIWYQDEILVKGLKSGLSFIVSSSLIEPYDQELLCKEILNFLRAPIEEDSDLI
jgi:hypothetical protein